MVAERDIPFSIDAVDLTRVRALLASGIASRLSTAERQIETISGERHLTRRAPGDDLTDRERETLHLLAERLPAKEIALQMTISPLTVKRHLRSIYLKLGVSTARMAIDRATDPGILTGPPADSARGDLTSS